MISLDQNEKQKRDEAIAEAFARSMRYAALFLAAAVVVACFAYTRVDDGVAQIATYGIAAFLGFISLVIAFLAFLARSGAKNRNNFFLYDRKTRQNMSADALTFEEMRSRLLRFMGIFRQRGKLYIGDLFDDEHNIPEQFKPLFCYEILYELATDDGIDAETFLSYGPECAQRFSQYLRDNRDDELALKINTFIYSFSSDKGAAERFCEYMHTQSDHIREKMLSYTIENIEKFD